MSDIKRINVNSNKATINPDYDAKLNHTDASLFTADALKHIAGYNPSNGINIQNAVDVLAKKHSSLESKAAYISDSYTDSDLDLTDESGYVLARFNKGHFQTLNFDSSKDATTENRGLMSAVDKTKLNTVEEGAEVNDVKTDDTTTNADLDFSDEQGNVLIRASEGHIKTNNFDSSAIKEENLSEELLGTFSVNLNKAEFKCYEPLFRYDFTDITNIEGAITPNFDITNLINFNITNLTENGYNPTTSFLGYLEISKICEINNFCCKAKIKLQDLSSVIGIGSIDILNNGRRGSQIKFDFNNKQILVCAKSKGNIEINNIIYTYNISSIIDNSLEYYIEIGRINRAIYIKITNFKNGNSKKFICPTADISSDDYTPPESYPIGCLVDKLIFFQISGTIAFFQKFTCFIPSHLKMVFFGDSITEGYGSEPNLCWANKVAEYIGNSINAGRNGSEIDLLIQQLTDMLPILKPEYTVVTIGTNNIRRGNIQNIKQKFENIIQIIKDNNSIPIINTLCRQEQIYDEDAKMVNNSILELHVLTSRFDIATSTNFDINDTQNTTLYLSDKLHLNLEGNDVIFKRFIEDIGENLKGNINLY